MLMTLYHLVIPQNLESIENIVAMVTTTKINSHKISWFGSFQPPNYNLPKVPKVNRDGIRNTKKFTNKDSRGVSLQIRGHPYTSFFTQQCEKMLGFTLPLYLPLQFLNRFVHLLPSLFNDLSDILVTVPELCTSSKSWCIEPL